MSVMHSLGLEDKEHEVTKFISMFTSEQDLHINYSEFVAATLDKRLYLDQEKLWNIFQYFDTDQSGEITIGILRFYILTIENMMDVMARSARKMSKNEVKVMLSEGSRKLNKINFEEFCEIMKDDQNK
jgi:calcium-dependent protein kinase